MRIQLQVDARRVKRSVDRWENAVLFQTGGFIRKLIQASMRTGRKQHVRQRRRANRPPLRWEGTLAELVLFDANLKRSTVSWGVGRIKTKSSSRKGIPRVLEEGGAARVEVLRRDPSDPSDPSKWVFVKVRAKYRKFPYIAPQKQRAIDFMAQKIEALQLEG